MPRRKERPDPNKSLVGFVVGDVAYAVPIAQVQEIVAPLGLTELPHAPAAVAGVADHRGQVIPIVDLRARFKLPVHLFDERLTSVEANRVLDEAQVGDRKRKDVVDQLAAVLILQAFMDFRASSRE